MEAPHVRRLLHAVPMMLETDTIEHLDRIAHKLSQQEQREVSRSEAVSHLVLAHWMQTKKKAAQRYHERAVRSRVT